MDDRGRRSEQRDGVAEWFAGLINARPEEVGVALLSALWFFFALGSYYILRPIRDEMGAAGGTSQLAWLYTGTMATMLIAQPLYGWVATGRRPRRFIPWVYRFFMLNLFGFFLALKFVDGEALVWTARAFFVWVSVFNLFVVSIFWQRIVDVFRLEQGKRLFGFIAVGGTCGAIAGSAVPSFLAEHVGRANLILVSIALLEVACWCSIALARKGETAIDGDAGTGGGDSHSAEAQAKGSVQGIIDVLRSPYLLGVCVYMLLFTFASTVLYFAQAEVLQGAYPDRDQRTAVFGRIDLAVNTLTLVMQLFLTGRIMRWIGVGATLAILPIASIVGFSAIGLYPVVAAVVVFQVVRRSGNFALARPARETLFTIVPRDDKYKAKAFIDTFVYRGGDQIAAWSYAGLAAAGLAMGSIALVTAPLCVVWLGSALWLGRRQKALAGRQDEMAPVAPAVAS
ncbi:MAG: Npt1/Npt2 family nucleotide transporter [Planctomycetota bacterium]|nr:Npt1/Npt2 family nucleotide transporter [Planctomycetota bacterium]